MASLTTTTPSAVDAHSIELNNLLSTRATLISLNQPVESLDADIKRLCSLVASTSSSSSGEVKTDNSTIILQDSSDSDDDDFSRAVALSLDPNERVDAFVVRCQLDGCKKRCPLDKTTGGTWDFCCKEHAKRATTLAQRPCGLPGCNIKAKLPSDYCSEDHKRRADERGLLAPHEYGVERVYLGASRDYAVSIMMHRHHKYNTVRAEFLEAWRKDYGNLSEPRVKRILQLSPTPFVLHRFEEYSKKVGNVRRLFHGTSSAENCRFALDLERRPCNDEKCSLCNICQNSLELRFAGKGLPGSGSSAINLRYGPGLYFSPCSGKSNDYAVGSGKLAQKMNGRKRKREIWRVMCVCQVALGRSYRTEKDMPHLTKPPHGFDSISGEVGNLLNFPECVVYDEAAVCPKYLIVYSPPQ
jgi:hypothetical protein